MVKGVVQERSFEIVPEGWYIAKLVRVASKDVGGYQKLKWKWEVVEPAEFTGKELWGECWQRLDQSDGCTWRRWHEALIERPVGVDEEVDTDNVINYMARVRVQHRSYADKNTGEEKWTAEIPDDPLAVVPVATDDADLPQFEASGSPVSQGWAATPQGSNGQGSYPDPWANAAPPAMDEAPF